MDEDGHNTQSLRLPPLRVLLAPGIGACLVLCAWIWAGGLLAGASGQTYGGAYVPQGTWDAIHALSVQEIVGFAGQGVDCGVTITQTRVQDGTWQPHGFLSFPIAAGSRLGSVLNAFVAAAADAKWACSTVWYCAAVDVYSIQDSVTLAAYYYSTQEGNGSWTAAPPGDTPTPSPSPARWVYSARVNRTVGYDCPRAGGGGSLPDPVFLYDTYIGPQDRFASLHSAGILPPLSDLGLPASRTATRDDVAAAASAILWDFVTQAHKWRLWPNAGCALTPLTRDPTSGCSRARCPTFTVCPAGFRLHVDAWGTCFPSLNASAEEVVVDVAPTRYSLATQALTLPWPGPNSTLVVNTSQAVEARSPIGAVLPCKPSGAATGAGVCSHYSATTGLASVDVPVCVCPPLGGPGGVVVAGDSACQLSPESCFPVGVNASGWLAASSCSGHGTCTFTRHLIDWSVVNLGSRASGAVSCVCQLPFTGPLCATSWCADSITGVDCHTAGTGVCVGNGTGADPGAWDWACACSFPNFGPSCQFTDAPLAGDAAVNAFSLPSTGGVDVSGAAIRGLLAEGGYSCWTTAGVVQDPPSGADTDAPLLCGGRGLCVPTPGWVPGQRAGTCLCDSGWQGPRCEWAACDHATTCGLYGRCFADVEVGGRARMGCACATHEADVGMVLAVTQDDSSTRCDVALCGGGALVLTYGAPGVGGSVPDWDVRTVPRGVCSCTSTVLDLEGSVTLGTPRTVLDRFGVPHSVAWPLHPFLPTLVDSVITLSNSTGQVVAEAPYAYIPSIQLSNTGARCEQPACPIYTNPAAGRAGRASGTYPCGADAASWEAVCVPCGAAGGASPGTFCAFSGGTGGYCDCEGGAWAAAHDTPYFLEPWSSRWAPAANPANPMCDPYCKNSGVWSPTSGQCNCGGTGFIGRTCETSRCPRGTPATGSGANCSACPLGWDLASECTTCARGYAGPTCGDCAPGFFATGSPRVCTSCATAASVACTPPGSIGYTCQASGPACVCAPGYANGVAGQCATCAPGYLGVTTAGVWSCRSCATVASCGGVFTKRALCGPPASCECTLPNMNAGCTGCDSSHRLVGSGANASCVPCATALGCNPAGTLNATCVAGAPSRDACFCNTTAGYTGPQCTACAPGWKLVGGTCSRCGGSGGTCGAWGTLDCNTSPASCACTHGMGGPACSMCTACGVGGECVLNATAGAPWCRCLPGFVKLGGEGNLTAPCSLCSDGVSIPDPGRGTCVLVTSLCGTGLGVNVLATAVTGNLSTCVCFPGFTGPGCGACFPGFAGPMCAPCSGITGSPGSDAGLLQRGRCAWDPVGMRSVWECPTGVTGTLCDTCEAGWVGVSPGVPRAPPCVSCPVCGRGGVCTPGYSATCTCLPGFTRRQQGNVTAPCDICAPGTSPVRCLPCGDCVFTQTCAEPEAEDATRGVCTCSPGLQPLAGVDVGPGVYCFPPNIATLLDLAVAGAEHPQETRNLMARLDPSNTPPPVWTRPAVFAYSGSPSEYGWLAGGVSLVVVVSLAVVGVAWWVRDRALARHNP